MAFAEAFEDLKTTLYNDSAVAGEAAGIGMGLVMLGSGGQRFADEMLQYAHETQHEKIIRGLAIGIERHGERTGEGWRGERCATDLSDAECGRSACRRGRAADVTAVA